MEQQTNEMFLSPATSLSQQKFLESCTVFHQTKTILPGHPSIVATSAIPEHCPYFGPGCGGLSATRVNRLPLDSLLPDEQPEKITTSRVRVFLRQQ